MLTLIRKLAHSQTTTQGCSKDAATMLIDRRSMRQGTLSAILSKILTFNYFRTRPKQASCLTEIKANQHLMAKEKERFRPHMGHFLVTLVFQSKTELPPTSLKEPQHMLLQVMTLSEIQLYGTPLHSYLQILSSEKKLISNMLNFSIKSNWRGIRLRLCNRYSSR